MTHDCYIMNHCLLLFSRVVVLIDSRRNGGPNNKGFSLVELITVMGIIAVLATMSIPAYNSYINEAKNSHAIGDIRTLSTDISAYYIDRGNYPTDLSVINRGGFKDPWKNAYVYKQSSTLMDKDNFGKLNSDYDICSTGSTGNGTVEDVGGFPANDDDIVRSNDGSFVGLRP